MASYYIEVTEEAKEDLSYYTASERKTITTGIRTQFTYQPMFGTQNRKQLRDNPIATWELRLGIYRVFYEADETTSTVTIVSVGHKVHNALYIRGKEVKL